MSGRTERAGYLCIGCPLGCRLEVAEDETGEIEVRGNSCKRGLEFARQEHRDPRRMVATTVRVAGGRWARVPVKTVAAVPKGEVVRLCRVLHSLTLTAPLAMGTVVLEDALGMGIDVVATRDMPSRS